MAALRIICLSHSVASGPRTISRIRLDESRFGQRGPCPNGPQLLAANREESIIDEKNTVVAGCIQRSESAIERGIHRRCRVTLRHQLSEADINARELSACRKPVCLLEWRNGQTMPRPGQRTAKDTAVYPVSMHLRGTALLPFVFSSANFHLKL